MRTPAASLPIALLAVGTLVFSAGLARAQFGGETPWTLSDLLLPSKSDLTAAAKTAAGAAGKAGEAVKEPAEAIWDLLDVAQRSLAQLGTDIRLEVKYEPEDAPGAVHAKHDPEEDLERRRITLTAQVDYLYDWDKEIPAQRVRGWVGKELPKKGPRSGVQVRWYFAPELLKHCVLRAHDFKGMNPTFYDTTRADGHVTAHLYPIPDHPLGGTKKTAEGDVRAWAKTQTAREAPRDPVGTIMTVGEDLLPGGCQTTQHVRLEYHAPTRWEGELTITRSVTKSYGTTAREPKRNEQRIVSVTGNQLWTATLRVPHLALDIDGNGHADYTLEVEAEGKHSQLAKFRTVGRRGQEVVYDDRLEQDLTGKGEENGKLSIRLDASRRDQPTYALITGGAAGATALSPVYFSGGGTETHTWQDDEGTHTMTNPAQMRPDVDILRGLSLPGEMRPQDVVLAFDRDAPTLADAAHWERDYASRDGAVKYHLSTQMEWTLKRVPDTGQGGK